MTDNTEPPDELTRLIARRLTLSSLPIRSIAQELGVSHQRVSRVERRLVQNLWRYASAQGAKLTSFV